MQLSDMAGHDAETQAIIGAAVVWVIERLKRWPQFSLLKMGGGNVNATVNIVSAIIIGAGFNYHHQVLDTGQYQFVVTLPTIGMAMHSLYQVLNQQVIYGALFRGQRTVLGTGTYPVPGAKS